MAMTCRPRLRGKMGLGSEHLIGRHTVLFLAPDNGFVRPGPLFVPTHMKVRPCGGQGARAAAERAHPASRRDSSASCRVI
jgi:hypothetical protein